MAAFIKSLPTDYLDSKKYQINAFYLTGEIKIDQQGCHIWKKGTNRAGYPIMKLTYDGNSKTISVHTLVLYLTTGILPSPGSDTSHLCHKKSCINPSHLVIEAHRQNCERRQCKAERRCTGHENNKSCIFF